MKSLRARLTIWFGCSFVAVTAVFVTLMYRSLDEELRQKSVSRDYPEHPEWKLHGSFSRAEVNDIMAELTETALFYALPTMLFALAIGYFLARRSMQPISNVNYQLQRIEPNTLNQRINIEEVDVEYRDLVRNVNDLLVRLDGSFSEMREYAAKVAHELRTPLSILRLKIEQSAGQIAPEFAEDLQNELQRLGYVVDQSLLIARAEHGRLKIEKRPVKLGAFLEEIVADFRLLAADRRRNLRFEMNEHCWVAIDPRFFKQALHSLLSNALKHGEGEIRVRMRQRGAKAFVTIANSVRREPTPAELTLGLGLRVVKALLRLDPSVRWRRKHGKRTHIVSIRCPTVTALSQLDQLTTARAEPLDPVI